MQGIAATAGRWLVLFAAPMVLPFVAAALADAVAAAESSLIFTVAHHAGFAYMWK